MSCWHFGLRRKFVPYLEGKISDQGAKRLEKHLSDCEDCRVMFVRLRAGHQFAQQLRPFEPKGASDAPEFEAMSPDIGEMAHGRHRWVRMWERWLDIRTTPRAVQALMVLVVVQFAILVVLDRKVLFGERGSASVKPSALDFSHFRPLSIQELQTNTTPHVVTEGYVRDVHFDEEERTMHFDLVQIPQGSELFIVCEIISRSEIPVPYEGSRVRVYGVARYDGQTGRKWNEVNPVLNIAVLQQ
jgi:hypothetical protein